MHITNTKVRFTMDKTITLQEYVEHQISAFKIKNTSKNQEKIKMKAMRELQKLGLWQQAKTKKVSRYTIKVFNNDEIALLNQKMENYLLKEGGLDVKEYLRLKKQNAETIEDPDLRTVNNLDSLFASNIPRDDLQMVMLTALFEKFFTPINLEQWEYDQYMLDFAYQDDEIVTTPEFIQAQMRLNDPKKRSYFSERKGNEH